MADRPLLIGGPLDGASIAAGARPAFIYCVPASPRDREARAKVFARPARGSELYRCEGSVAGVQRFVYAGHLYRRCDDCGTFLEATSLACQFCGFAISR